MNAPSQLHCETRIHKPLAYVWTAYNQPNHIVRWNAASDDWHCPQSQVDLRPGGRFCNRMESRDGAYAFDFEGEYQEVVPESKLVYTLDDGRLVEVVFEALGDETRVKVAFEAENTHPHPMQQQGWQAILERFAAYTERLKGLNPLHFEQQIAASPEKVAALMLGADTYPFWTAAFNGSSGFRGSWEEGEEICFIGKKENGKEVGMIGEIAVHRPAEYVAISFTGLWDDGQAIYADAEVAAFKDTREEYRFVKREGGTLLVVDIDDVGEHYEHFMETWPNALRELKKLAENAD